MKTKIKNSLNNIEDNKIYYEYNNNFFILLLHFLYKLIGRKILLNKKFSKFFYKNIYNKHYEIILRKANIKLLPEEYFISILLILVFTILSIFITSFIYLFINIMKGLIIFYVGIMLLLIIGILMYNFPIVIFKQRGKEIDASLPYLLPYMKILAKEISLSQIINIIDDFLIYKEIKVEFKKIKYYSDFLGYDIQSSIRESMVSCPSKELSDLMNDLVTISNSGGNIYNYLERKLSNLDLEINAIEKKNIDTLLIFSQIYVVVLLISPLFFTIMSTILNLISFGSETISSGGNSTASNILLLLVILPFLYVGFMMLIYYSKPLYSRLKPIET